MLWSSGMPSLAFFLRKLISSFLYPPGLFVSFFFLLWLWRKERIHLFLAILFYFVSIDPAKDLIVYPLEGIPPPPPSAIEEADVYVVLGGGAKADPWGGKGGLEPFSLQRLLCALRLYRISPKRIILSGGSVLGSPIESLVARRVLLEVGVPEGDVIAEGESRDTLENARRVKGLCAELGCERPLVITNAFHLRRAMMAFRPLFPEAIPFPCGTLREGRYTPGSFLPDPQNLYAVSLAVREYLGLVYYRMRGKP